MNVCEMSDLYGNVIGICHEKAASLYLHATRGPDSSDVPSSLGCISAGTGSGSFRPLVYRGSRLYAFTHRAVYFETENFESALGYVRQHGFLLTGEPNCFPDLSEFTLLDPDGNRIVIAQMK